MRSSFTHPLIVFCAHLPDECRFKKGWDVKLIQKLLQLSRYSNKPIISQYLLPYKPQDLKDEDAMEKRWAKRPQRLTGKFFHYMRPRDERMVRQFNLTAYVDFDPYPLKVR